MEERVKHRIVGLAVILSVGVIITPAVVKKSAQRYELQRTVRANLPKHPPLPKVAVVDEQETFKQIKVAHINLDKSEVQTKFNNTIATASPLAKTAPKVAKVKIAKTIQSQKPLLKYSKTSKTIKKPIKRYSVQLASFTKQKNATKLTHTLNKKGYNARTSQVTNKKGLVIYQVLVGSENKKNNAVRLQHRLAQTTKLKGIIVTRKNLRG